MTGRKPVDLVAAAAKPQGRDAIWAAIRAQRAFTFRSLREATDVNQKTIRDYVQSLQAAGIVARREDTEVGAARFELVSDRGVHAPRVRKDGSEVEQGRATEAMWSAMRLLKQLTPRDLAVHASTDTAPISEVHAKDYCKHLANAKYLRVLQDGGPNRQAIYHFVRFTGPKAPMIQRVKQVFDPNTGQVVWTKEAPR